MPPDLYGSLFERIAIGIILIDADGYCLEANQAALDILESEDAVGRQLTELGSVATDDLDNIRALLRDQGFFKAYELTTTELRGNRRLRLNGHRVDLAPGPQPVWVVIEDVTKESATAQAVTETNRQLEASNRQLDYFASMAAHDLKAPARRVRMFTDLVIDSGHAFDEKLASYLGHIHTSATQMEEIVDALLGFARITPASQVLEPVDLREVIGAAILSQESEIRALSASVTVEGTFPPCDGNAVLLEQLFRNLIVNSLKYRRQDLPITVSIIGADDGLSGPPTISITDNGIGFPENEAPLLFDMLYQAHGRSEFGGHGIGLAICAKIARVHGWTMMAHGEPDGGAKFTITLAQQ